MIHSDEQSKGMVTYRAKAVHIGAVLASVLGKQSAKYRPPVSGFFCKGSCVGRLVKDGFSHSTPLTSQLLDFF
jgi:hypothetical protein